MDLLSTRAPIAGALLALLAACSPAVPQPASTVIGWALGPEHLASEPPPGDRYLLAVSASEAGAPQEPSERRCLQAKSFLPAPAPETRIFVLIGGQLHVLATPNSEPERLTGVAPSLTITRMLAFTRPPAARALLVTARPQGAAAEQIWLLTLADKAVTSAHEVTDKRAFVSQEAFFRQYDAPKCKPGGQQCLVLSADEQGSFIDVEPVRGKPPEQLKKLGKIQVADAAWASGDGRTIYLLLPCGPSK